MSEIPFRASTDFVEHLQTGWPLIRRDSTWTEEPSVSASDADPKSSATPDGASQSSSGGEAEEELSDSIDWTSDPWPTDQRSSAEIMRHCSDLHSASYLREGLAEWQDQILGQSSSTPSSASGIRLYHDPQFSGPLTLGKMLEARLAQLKTWRIACESSRKPLERYLRPSRERSSFFAKMARLLSRLGIRRRG